MLRSRVASIVLTSLVLAPSAHAAILGPTAYSSTADSPFFPTGGFSYFHLEDFDDHLLNTPGVTVTLNTFSSVNSGFSGAIIDQVGSDGGCPDGGLTQPCDTWFAGNGSAGLRFTFNAAVLGQLPNAVGIVWTDGFDTIRFEAFDANGVSLGSVTGSHSDSSVLGTTADDRFYGATTSGGISSFVITNSSGGIEVDHLQYGFRPAVSPPPNGVPEPGSLALLGLGAGILAWRRRRES